MDSWVILEVVTVEVGAVTRISGEGCIRGNDTVRGQP